MARSTSFVVEGDVNTRITIAELGGILRFDLEVLGSGLIGDLRGLFFDLSDPDSADPLDLTTLAIAGTLTHDDVGNTAFEEGAVDTVGKDANLKGEVTNQFGDYDVGVEFGASGMSKDDIQQTSFLLSSSTGPLSLNMLDLTDFGIRYTSVGEAGGDRSASLKLGDRSSGVADNDLLQLDENATDSVDLLANDTNGATNTVTSVVDAAGGFTQIAGGFERQVVVDGRILGVLTVSSAGVATFAATGADVDALAVGEQADFTFSYTTTASDQTSFATADVDLTVFGVNDLPVISVETGDSAAETILETNAPLAGSGALTLTDLDRSDFVGVSVISVTSSGKDDDAETPDNNTLLGMLTLAPTAVLDDTETVQTFGWFFDSGTTTFDYLADDESITFDYTIRATDDNAASDDQVVSITVDGTNDQPVSQDVSGIVVGEDEFSIDGAFIASDLDTTDQLIFQIIGEPTDASGNRYGSVENNFDGTFVFLPGDEFQFLELGETRDVTFEYIAIDDSGAANGASAPRTATITVVGAFDAPIEQAGALRFVTEDQSQFDTGAADDVDVSLLGPSLDFVGFEWDEDFSATIISKLTFSGDVLEGLLEGIEDLVNAIADVGCTIGSIFGADCEGDVDLPSSISTPGVSLSGSTSGKVGLQPFFELRSGGVDSTIPVDVVFTTPHQVEAGDTFLIESAFTVDDGATFMTQSPDVRFGLDLIFQAAAEAAIAITSSTFGAASSFDLFPDIDIDETVNLFTFDSADDDPPSTFDLTTFGSLTLGAPEIETSGAVDDDPTLPDISTLSSTGEDDIAVLNVDVDKLVSALPLVPPFGISANESLSVDIAGESVNLLGFEVNFDLIAVNLINTLSAVQNFSLGIEDLPLVATFEDGSMISGLSLGDAIIVTAPTGFDADLDGDADGQIDFGIDVDMDAVFSNLTTLGFSTDLFYGLLRATASVTSDFAADKATFNLFPQPDLTPAEMADPTANDFLLSDTLNLFETDDFATLYENEDFDLAGFEDNTSTVDTFWGMYDVA